MSILFLEGVFGRDDFLSLILLVVLFVIALVLVFLLIYNKYIKPERSFKDVLNDTKLIQIAVRIDLEEKKVEKYYLYDQNHKTEFLSLDEFYVRFDKINAEKLRRWLNYIARSGESEFSSKTHRLEVIMYENNARGVYLAELESYNQETKVFYLNFKDITESLNIYRRIGKIEVRQINEAFYDEMNEKVNQTDVGALNYLVAIKFKERNFAEKELHADALRLIEENIYLKLSHNMFDRDLLCATSNGTFLLFCHNISNIKKFKHNIKNLLNNCSGEYSIIQNKFNYMVHLIAGCTIIKADEKVTNDKTLEAETAANELLSRSHSSDKFLFYDEKMRSTHNEINNQVIQVEKIVAENLFELEYVPIIKTKSKSVDGYFVKLVLPTSVNMDIVEFIKLVKERSVTMTLYSKIFAKILEANKGSKKNFYISFDFDCIARVMEAYKSDDSFTNINYCFCIEFSSTTLQNTDLITIEKTLASHKDSSKVRFGINYNSLSTIYLNDKIYMKADIVLISGQLSELMLQTYTAESLVDIYTKVAASYGQEVIGLNVDSLAIYEMYVHYNIKKVGGDYLTKYVEEDKIRDKSVLKTLSEIEVKTY